MKKASSFIVFMLVILMSGGVAFTASPPTNTPGYYIKVHGATAGTIKYFPNGHPQPNKLNEWNYCGSSPDQCNQITPPTPCPGCNDVQVGQTYSSSVSGGSFESIKLPALHEGPSAAFNGSGVGDANATVNTQMVSSDLAFEAGYAKAMFKNPATKGGQYIVGDANSDYMGALAWSKQSFSAEAFGSGIVNGITKNKNCDYPEGFVSVNLFIKEGGAASSQYAQAHFSNDIAAGGYAAASGWQQSSVNVMKSTYVDAKEWKLCGVKGATGVAFDRISAGASVFGASGADITRVGDHTMDTNSVTARSFNVSISKPGYVTGNPDTSTFSVSGRGIAIGLVHTTNPLGMSGNASYNGSYSYSGSSNSPISGSGFTYGTASVSITPTTVTSTSSGFSWAGTK